MKIVIVKDYDEMSKAAAELAVSLVQDKPHAVLSFATGSTPWVCMPNWPAITRWDWTSAGLRPFI